ncbi:MAG TPA: Lsr2 family protein [Streptosporangiaceae bacterium]
MAQRTEIVFTDDLDGGPADETVRFGIDGTQYEIDLSKAHALELRSVLEPFVASARRVTAGGAGAGAGRRASRPAARRGPNPSDVRAWARSEGIEVKDKGRVPSELVVKFQAAGQ